MLFDSRGVLEKYSHHFQVPFISAQGDMKGIVIL